MITNAMIFGLIAGKGLVGRAPEDPVLRAEAA
jgi:hypothetical protein